MEWCTVSHNLKHSYSVNGRKSAMKGKQNEGTKKYNSKRIECFKDGLSIGIFESMSLTMKHFGFSTVMCISRVAHGKRESHKGYVFKFVRVPLTINLDNTPSTILQANGKIIEIEDPFSGYGFYAEF